MKHPLLLVYYTATTEAFSAFVSYSRASLIWTPSILTPSYMDEIFGDHSVAIGLHPTNIDAHAPNNGCLILEQNE